MTESISPPGVWIVSDTLWCETGPGLAVPYPDEQAALRAVNDAGWQQRAYFVPYGADLRDSMNQRRITTAIESETNE